MFEELENMVQSLGNHYIENRVNNEPTKIVEYEATESQYSVNNEEIHILTSKCQYLETLNQNLVNENDKLKKQVKNHFKISKNLELELREKNGNLIINILQKMNLKKTISARLNTILKPF